jgi:uncharacterized protein (TIGR00730 family)
MTKAYKNIDFLMSHDARPVRILSEYMEPQSRFREKHVHRAVVFFGSARTREGQSVRIGGRDYYEEARALAARLAAWTTAEHAREQRYFICTGGGPGIMEAANRGAAEENPELSIGLNISLPFEQGSNAYLSEDLNLEFHYFFMRKFWFLNLARAMVIFPGGFGTMDELFEVLALLQTSKKNPMPLLLYGREFWDRLIDFNVFVEEGLISPGDLALFHTTDDVESAFGYLREHLDYGPVSARRETG